MTEPESKKYICLYVRGGYNSSCEYSEENLAELKKLFYLSLFMVDIFGNHIYNVLGEIRKKKTKKNKKILVENT